jgi:hypothetical protein
MIQAERNYGITKSVYQNDRIIIAALDAHKRDQVRHRKETERGTYVENRLFFSTRIPTAAYYKYYYTQCHIKQDQWVEIITHTPPSFRYGYQYIIKSGNYKPLSILLKSNLTRFTSQQSAPNFAVQKGRTNCSAPF